VILKDEDPRRLLIVSYLSAWMGSGRVFFSQAKKKWGSCFVETHVTNPLAAMRSYMVVLAVVLMRSIPPFIV
jgi:hypothetical protein